MFRSMAPLSRAEVFCCRSKLHIFGINLDSSTCLILGFPFWRFACAEAPRLYALCVLCLYAPTDSTASTSLRKSWPRSLRLVLRHPFPPTRRTKILHLRRGCMMKCIGSCWCMPSWYKPSDQTCIGTRSIEYKYDGRNLLLQMGCAMWKTCNGWKWLMMQQGK